MRRAALALALAACSGARVQVTGTAPGDPSASAAADGDAAVFRDATVAQRVADGETAWLLAHLADEPDRAHAGESDAVRRLSQRGADGVLAVAEVFRVGDAARAPFARRVVERVALRRCLRDVTRAAWQLRRIDTGEGSFVADAGITWRSDEPRWSSAALERLRAWGAAGAPCEAPERDAGLDAG